MKLLAYLGLTLFVGICQSRSVDFSEEELWPEYDFDYTPSPSIWDMIQQTALGKTISDKVSESVGAVGQYFSQLEEKAGPMFQDLGRKVDREGSRFASQVERHVDKKVQGMSPQAETFAADVQKQLNDTFQDIQKKTIVVVEDFHGQFMQSSETIRKKTESFVESVGQSMQTELAKFWESLTKGN